MHSHEPGPRRISRRVIFVSALALMAGGCASATEQEARRFLSAVHADPLYSWRPGLFAMLAVVGVSGCAGLSESNWSPS